jgi:AcrR family transcriptional regulator
MSKTDTRGRLVEAALTVFSEKGYEAASTKLISEKAGVNEITLFRHFGNKENLFREVLARKAPISYLTEELDKRLTGNLQMDLTYLAQIYLKTQYNNLELIRIGMMEVPRNPSYASLIQMIPMRLEEHLEKYLANSVKGTGSHTVNFRLLARMFYSQLFQYIMTICFFPDVSESLKRDSEEFIQTLVSMFVQTLMMK